MTVGTEEKQAFAPEVHVIGIDELMAKWEFRGWGMEGWRSSTAVLSRKQKAV